MQNPLPAGDHPFSSCRTPFQYPQHLVVPAEAGIQGRERRGYNGNLTSTTPSGPYTSFLSAAKNLPRVTPKCGAGPSSTAVDIESTSTIVPPGFPTEERHAVSHDRAETRPAARSAAGRIRRCRPGTSRGTITPDDKRKTQDSLRRDLGSVLSDGQGRERLIGGSMANRHG